MVARQVLFIHIGLPKTGTSYLQRLFWDHQQRLRDSGFALVPAERDENDELMLAVSGRYVPGRDPASVPDAPARFAAEISACTEPVALLSNESLAATPPERIGELVAACGGREVHAIITTRDLGRLLPSAWQQAVKAGSTTTYRHYLDELASSDAARGEGRWRTKNVEGLIASWGAVVGVDRVHVVTVPPPGAAPDTLLRRFCEVVGVDPEPFLLDEPAVANPGLDAVSVELLRQVNLALPDKWRQARRIHGAVMKRYFSAKVLSGLSAQDAPRLTIPTADREWVLEVAAGQRAAIETSGCHLVGSLDDLTPSERCFADQEPVSSDEVATLAAAALAELLVARMEGRRSKRARASRPASEAQPTAVAALAETAAQAPATRRRRGLFRRR